MKYLISGYNFNFKEKKYKNNFYEFLKHLLFIKGQAPVGILLEHVAKELQRLKIELPQPQRYLSKWILPGKIISIVVGRIKPVANDADKPRKIKPVNPRKIA